MNEQLSGLLDRLIAAFGKDPFDGELARQRCGIDVHALNELCIEGVVEELRPGLYRVADAGHG
ncbi:MAG: hypothetical protein H7A21_08735 [Spirochaetales bacterium]|nr:hypothetical protein [Spirochaetales bacterium]MCP5484332.1 hypothetical protein [Spirochaetales bacterium]